jgi:transcriptional regulator with XRE-family HTH domain
MLPSLENSRFDESEREFLGLTLERQIFGAIYAAIEDRKSSHGMTRTEFGERTGRDKTGVSKLLRGPSNWTIHTIAAVANALELTVEITFVDQYDPFRVFTPTGLVEFPRKEDC